MLQKGSSGAKVTKLQHSLILNLCNPGPVDGLFGIGTDKAVRDFQKRKKLKVDGIVGPQTWAKLEEGGNGMLSKNFNRSEFACKHCGQVIVSPELVRKLQELRDRLGRPVTITSGYRCQVHNRAVGGASQSQHMLGTAADIVVSGMTPAQVAQVAEGIGFGGIGRYKTFTHVDVRAGKARWNG